MTDGSESHLEALHARIAPQWIEFFGSGTQAIAAGLLSLARNDGRTDVIVPAYGCPRYRKRCLVLWPNTQVL